MILYVSVIEIAGFAPDGARNPIDFDGLAIPEIRYRMG